MSVQGERGERGERGKQGPGLSRAVRRAVVFLFVLSVALGGLNLLWSAHEANSTRTAIQAEHDREQAAQRRQAEMEFRALCTTFTKLAALKPPPGDPKTNPSRAYLQGQHDTLDELGADLGCKG